MAVLKNFYFLENPKTTVSGINLHVILSGTNWLKKIIKKNGTKILFRLTKQNKKFIPDHHTHYDCHFLFYTTDRGLWL